jgi:hypothetical protein
VHIDALAAVRLVQKLREFSQTGLDEDERALFAVLLAPGIAQAYARDDVSGYSVGYSVTEWDPRTFPESLAAALRESGVMVIGLDD